MYEIRSHNIKGIRSPFKRLAMNEEKVFNKSRSCNHPIGRSIAFTKMQQQLLRYNDVFTNLKFVQMPTKAFEYHSTTKNQLDCLGNLRRPDHAGSSDVTDSVTDVCAIRDVLLPIWGCMTGTQQLMLESNVGKASKYDNIHLFGLRPVELL